MTDLPVTELVDKYATKIIEAVQQYGPQTTDMVLQVGRVGALNTVFIPTVMCIFSLITMLIAVRMIKKGMAYGKANEWEDPIPMLYFCPAVLMLVIAPLSFGDNIKSALNMYAWVGIWHPEIYLVSKALHL